MLERDPSKGSANDDGAGAGAGAAAGAGAGEQSPVSERGTAGERSLDSKRGTASERRPVSARGPIDGRRAANSRAVSATGAVRPRSLTEMLPALESLVDDITSMDPTALDGTAAAEASVRVSRATDRLTAQRLGWLGRVEGAGAWLGAGYRSFRAWVAGTHRMSDHLASSHATTASALRDTLIETSRAAREGRITTADATAIASTANTPARAAALGELFDVPHIAPGPDEALVQVTGERALLDLAQAHSLRDFQRLAQRFAHVVDPEADERGYREAIAREYFDLAATTGGYHLSGFLTTEHGQLVKTAMRAVTGTPASDDTRTVSQRRAGALAGLSRLVLDKGLGGTVGTHRPHLSVHVSHTELHDLHHRPCGAPSRPPVDLVALVTAPPAEWEDRRGPIPREVLRRIAADCEVTRVVFGPDSQVVDVGRTQRTFAGHLRRAVVARDRTCVWPGCGAPAAIGQIHHAVKRWADGGTTRVGEGALVCAFHNQWIEDARIPMRWHVDDSGAGRWDFGTPGTYRPDGSGHFPDDDGRSTASPRDGP